jgi:TonB-linked SusC/RagA family outer membrane protein
LEKASKVTINVQNVSVQEALDACFKNQAFLTYAIVQKSIIIKKKEQPVIMEEPAETSATNMHVLPLVRGVVKDETGPVAGATISIRGGKQMTTTNSNGEFTLEEVAENAVLIISSVSHEEQQIRLGGRGVLSILLKEKVNDLDEQVVVAYTKTTQRTATGSFTVVKGEQIQTLPNRSFDKSLQGLVPGLLVTNGTGQPGGGVASFVLRGIATGGSADNGSTVRNPLIVIDGIPVFQDAAQMVIPNTTAVTNPMAQINPSDIESISILKDAAAIALYGSKASNGVILITTKQGKSGKTVFSFRHQTDISSPLKGKTEVLNQREYLELLFESYRNTFPGMTDAAILADLRSSPNATTSVVFPIIVKAPGDTSFYPESDWKKAMYNNRATSMTNELSMSGGTEKNSFYLGLEYTKQNGIVKKTDYDRKSLRFNFESRPANWIKFGINTGLSYNVQNYTSLNDGVFGIGTAQTISPLNPVRLTDGNYVLNYNWGLTSSGGTSLANPVAAAEFNINRNTSYRGISKFYGEIKFLKRFTLSSNLGVDYMMTEAKEKVDTRLAVDGLPSGIGRIQERDIRRSNFISTNTLRFDHTLRKWHSINLLFGQEAQILNDKSMLVIRRNLVNPDIDQLQGALTLQDATGLTTKQTLLSYFGQANYGFRNKYFFTGSIRTDGSSRFGKNQRFGKYWSTGIAWLVTGESFMKATAGWLDHLKIRGSIGAAGNSSAITERLRFDLLTQLTYLNNLAILPDPNQSPGNANIQWEHTNTWDAGLELRLLKERIAITADVYSRKTSNLISFINIPSGTGFYQLTENIGDMKNNGIELSLSAYIFKKRDFSWNINANWSKNTNKLVKSFFPIETTAAALVANQPGVNYNSFYLKRWAGVDPATGLPQWIDSTTGKTTSDINRAKREFVGKPQPDGFGAVTNIFTYRNFELSTMFYYQYGFQVYYTSLLLNDGSNPYINQSKKALDRWQKPGDIASNPRRKLNNFADRGTENSTRYLYDGDFIRLKNVIITYNLPKRVVDRLHLSMLKLYAQGHNLAVWTKYPGQDPENADALGNTDFPYPQQRSYTLGVRIAF